MTIHERVARVREQMKIHGIHAYIIPSGDPHQSEYVADHWKSREWVSGFSGSAGTVVITRDHAGLWTDSRYFIQAEKQLKNTPITLHKLNTPHTPEHLQWLKENLKNGDTLGFDGWLFSPSQIDRIQSALEDRNVNMAFEHDLIEKAWTGRPPLPTSMVFEHSTEYAGLSRKEKINLIREKLKDKGAEAYLISTLDDIAWVLNLRGSDVDYNPVFIAYAIIGMESSFLFMDKNKLEENLRSQLHSSGIEIIDYGMAGNFLSEFSSRYSIYYDNDSTSVRMLDFISNKNAIEGENLIAPLKARKNETEIRQLRTAMERDGAVLVRLFRWLESELESRQVKETAVAEKLIELRKEAGNYFGESFAAIVGYEANGAIVHYKPEAEDCALIRKEGILLLDCGGQYTDGTTDITRTVALSAPTDQQKTDFTLVLKGNLAISMAKFPKGTNGLQIDVLARQYLWQHNRNYGHGTGHGVGFFLNVHEGPHGFSSVLSARTRLPIELGTVTSNEPGLYREGHYGIRIENLVLCVEDHQTEFGEFYAFETLSLFPIDESLIDTALLDEFELEWLNQYHHSVYERLAPYLNEEEKKWLEIKCSPIKRLG